ncbi:MAG TPA: hypothetical protein VMV31_07020 [Terriglobales bacterium]|nr:hypothetical protein [Terriglobales bacterium]
MRLYRYFLRSFFHSDLVARGGDPRSLAVAAAAFFGAPGVILCLYLALLGGQGDATPELAFFVALSMILTGLLAVLAWEDLFPSRTDVLVLRPLPVSARRIVGAKLAALASLVAGFAVIVNAYPTLLLPWMSAPGAASDSLVARMMAAQAVATAAGGAWAFLVVLALKGLVLALGREAERLRLAALLRFGLLAALLAALLLSPNLLAPREFFRLAARGPAWCRPLFWFIGLDRRLLGNAPPAWAGYGRGALPALAGAALAAVALYPLGCRRQFRAALGAASAPTGALARALRPGLDRFLPQPRQRAVFGFAAATLARSRRHRLYLSAWLGAGVAVGLETLLASPGRASAAPVPLLGLPLVLCFFLLLGLRHTFTLPIQPAANWIFRLSETDAQPERLGAAPKLMFAFCAAPVLLAALPLGVRLWGWRRAVMHLAWVGLLAVVLIEVLLLRFRKLPFTCPYLPDQANFKILWVLYWLGFTLYAQTMARLEYREWSQPWRWAATLLATAALVGALAWEGRRWRRQLPGCQFDDEPEALVVTLFSRD